MTRLATPQDAARWLHQRVRGVLRTDSRRVAAGDGFIAWPGAAADGRRFVADALAQGATACVVELEGVQDFGFDDAAIATYGALYAEDGTTTYKIKLTRPVASSPLRSILPKVGPCSGRATKDDPLGP